MSESVTAVLIHGAWANASCWAKIIPTLREQGVPTVAVQLPLTSLESDVAVVERALALIDGKAILVGHSYGGVVATVAGSNDKVQALVYVAAFAPDADESAGSLGATVEPAPLGAAIVPDAQGYLKLSEPGFNESFAQDLSDTEKLVNFVTQGPTSANALGAVVTSPAWKTKPSWYVLAEDDRAIQPSLQKLMAERARSTTVAVHSSHVVMLSHPETVSKVILAALA